MSAHQILAHILGGHCVRCNSIENLQIHHKDRDRLNNQLTNLELICERCHFAEHEKVYNHKWRQESQTGILTQKQRYVIKAYLTTGDKLEGFGIVKKAVKNTEKIKPFVTDLELIRQFLAKVEGAKP
jgi:hypothetical protein